MTKSDITDFTSVDRVDDPRFFQQFLDKGNENPQLRACKETICEGLRLVPGAHVLDIGCGLGADVFDIARRVGPTGRVQGIDLSSGMIDEAMIRSQSLRLPVSFEVGDAQGLRFSDETFDGCRLERVLMHVPDAVRAISETVRVTKRGGRVCVFDFDWDLQMVDSPFKDTTRKIARSFSDGMKNGWIGRQLPRRFREAGLVDVSVSTHMLFVDYPFLDLLIGGHLAKAREAGAFSEEELAEWWAQLRGATAAGTFSCGFVAFTVAGTRQ
jgi:ubiquinone/menaquinone biosynthesis C-methylase UbiE